VVHGKDGARRCSGDAEEGHEHDVGVVVPPLLMG
jgi:hypothetical protein